MKDVFSFSPYITNKEHDIFVNSQNTSNYGDRSLRALDHIHGTPYQKILNPPLL